MLDLLQEMMNLFELKSKIHSGHFPTEFPHFGGANLIITNDPERNGLDGDLVIYTEHAAALSWLVVQLKKIYDAKLDYTNKYDFYPYIGRLIESSVNANDDLFDTMLFVVERIEADWGE